MNNDKEKERLMREAENARINFSANVTHQLKTPLHAISGYSELIANGMATGEDAREFGFRIYMEAQRTLDMVNDILSLSKLDDPGEIFEEEEIDLCDLIYRIVTSFKTISEVKGVSLGLHMPESEKIIMHVSSKLIRGLTESLIDNALKYTEPGGSVDVYVECNEESHPVLIVKDTGIGIPEEDHEKVFQRFYRCEQDASSKCGGTGLGLTIVKQSVKRLGAKISLQSVQGKGTEIKVVF